LREVLDLPDVHGGSRMKVFTTRSGVVLHGSPGCRDLVGKRVFTISPENAIERAVHCTHGPCAVAFARNAERGAVAA
jgi:hypothetical protein